MNGKRPTGGVAVDRTSFADTLCSATHMSRDSLVYALFSWPEAGASTGDCVLGAVAVLPGHEVQLGLLCPCVFGLWLAASITPVGCVA